MLEHRPCQDRHRGTESAGLTPGEDLNDATSAVVCRTGAGVCDVAETCDGTGKACPADDFVDAGVTCRGATDVCDETEACTGTGPACPADAIVVAGVTCRAADAACPTDGFVAAGTECRGVAGDCDVAEACPATFPRVAMD